MGLAELLRAWRTIRRSGRFDGAHYVGQLRRIGLRRMAPLLHYLWSGERRGREPFAGFNPLLYLAEHEELLGTGISPLRHFLDHGGSWQPAPVDLDVAVREAKASVERFQPKRRAAIVCHIFYYRLFDEIAAAIGAADFEADLIFTVTEKPGFAALSQRIAAAFPNAPVIPFPNHGRDIFPFLTLAPRLTGYDAVCKIHSKASPHKRQGDSWRHGLLAPLLLPDGRVKRFLARLRDDPGAGAIVADSQVLGGDNRWEGNRPRTRELAARLGIDADRHPLRFPAGSMYWAGPKLISGLARLGLLASDFEPERGQRDDTTAHAVERLVGFILAADGQRALEVRDVLSP